MSVRFEMRLSEELLARVDAARGLVPRAAFVRDAVELAVGAPRSIGGVPESGARLEVEPGVLVEGPGLPVSPAEPNFERADDPWAIPEDVRQAELRRRGLR
jgi:hypothetical protein